mgnify:CR=1 FL=1
MADLRTKLFSLFDRHLLQMQRKFHFLNRLDRHLVESSKDTARARADIRFKKQEDAATVRQKAMAEYTAEADARKAKTNKLRALRLAKEAEDLASEPPAPAKKPQSQTKSS